MDVQSDTGAKLAQLNGMIQIAAATKTPLPALATVAKSCTSFKALNLGLKPLHPATHYAHMLAVAHQIGIGR